MKGMCVISSIQTAYQLCEIMHELFVANGTTVVKDK